MFHHVVSPNPNEVNSAIPINVPVSLIDHHPVLEAPGPHLSTGVQKGSTYPIIHALAHPRHVIRPSWCASPAFSKKADQPSQVTGLRRGTSEVLEQSAASYRRLPSSILSKVRGKVTLSMRQGSPTEGPVGHRLSSGGGVDPWVASHLRHPVQPEAKGLGAAGFPPSAVSALLPHEGIFSDRGPVHTASGASIECW